MTNNKELTLTGKIFEIVDLLDSLVEDYDKLRIYQDAINETKMPFPMSLDEFSAEVSAWGERVHEYLERAPKVTASNLLEIVHSEFLCDWIGDDDARLYIKGFGTRNEYTFKYTLDGQVHHNGCQEDVSVSTNQVIANIMNNKYEFTGWDWIEETDFVRWLTK